MAKCNNLRIWALKSQKWGNCQCQQGRQTAPGKRYKGTKCFIRRFLWSTLFPGCIIKYHTALIFSSSYAYPLEEKSYLFALSDARFTLCNQQTDAAELCLRKTRVARSSTLEWWRSAEQSTSRQRRGRTDAPTRDRSACRLRFAVI